MYLNPTGANPTGTILPEDRRREIYNLAVEHDMLIIEDDPYYYLQVGKIIHYYPLIRNIWFMLDGKMPNYYSS